MNRRSFISGVLAAAVAPMILPGTGRFWSRLGSGVMVPRLNPEWVDAPFQETYWWVGSEEGFFCLLPQIEPYFLKPESAEAVIRRFKLDSKGRYVEVPKTILCHA